MKGIQLFDEIHAYFIENVLSSYQDYKKRRFETKSGQSTDLRKALIASSFLYHFREHLPKQFIKSRKEFSVMCLDYDVLGDVVNVSKHNTLTQNWKYVNSVKNIFEIVVSTEFIDEKGKYFFHEKKILIKLIDDTERDINEILTNVLNMWYNYLYKVGILKKKYFEKFIKPEFPLSREKCGEGKLDLENIQGVRFNILFVYKDIII